MRAALRWLLITAWCAAASMAAPPGYAGKRVRAILFEPAAQPLSRDSLGTALAVRPGDPLQLRLLETSLERLFATGAFASVEADARLEEDEVVLTFRTTPNAFLSGIDVRGVPEPPTETQLQRAAGLETGRLFEVDDLPAAAGRMLGVLRENGFYGASVAWEVTQRAPTAEADVLFTVETGRRARLVRPAILGAHGRWGWNLMRQLGWMKWYGLRGWKEMTDSTVTGGVERVRNSYLRKGYLDSVVRVERLDWDEERNTVHGTLRIEPGARTQVATEGARASGLTLRRLVPVFEERVVDKDLLLEGAQNLTEFFEQKGYFEAQVGFREERDPGRRDARIVYRIHKGPRFRLEEIAFEGNRYFDERTLRARLVMERANWYRNRYGRFSKALLERDEESIAALYRANGFRDVKVTSEVRRAEGRREHRLAVKITVEEGPQWLVAQLDVAGVDLQLYEEVSALVTSKPGQPYSAETVAEDRDRVLNFYFDNGYPETALEVTEKPDAAARRVALALRVREGRRTFVRAVLVNGLAATNRDLVQSRLRIPAQSPLSQTRLVEAQRRLSDLGIFSRVDVAVQNPEGRTRDKFVLFQLEEASRYSFLIGGGFEVANLGGVNDASNPQGRLGVAPRFYYGVTRNNFLGLGHTAAVQTRLSTLRQRVTLNYLAPQFQGSERWSLSFSSLFDRSKDVRTYTSTRSEGNLQLAHQATRASLFQYRFAYRFVTTGDVRTDPLLIPLLSQPVRIGMPSATYIRDKRDDPGDARRGTYNLADFGVAGAATGSQASFTRFIYRNSSYHTVARDVVFARTASLGWIENLGHEPIPLPERFYAGGSTSHRGFAPNQAGPRDLVTGYPLGGNAYLLASHELRFPLPVRSIGAVLFWDAGNVFSERKRITLRSTQRNGRDFDYLVHTVGLGVRYKTPVGPMRFDAGYTPNPPRFEGYTNAANPAANVAGVVRAAQRLSRFQFHFSLGQAF